MNEIYRPVVAASKPTDNYVTILSISDEESSSFKPVRPMRKAAEPDEPSASTSSATIIAVSNGVSYSRNAPNHRSYGDSDDVVEVTDLSLQPALDVDVGAQHKLESKVTASPSILRKQHQTRLGSETRHVTYSEEATQLRAQARRSSVPHAVSPQSEEDSPPKMSRTGARKSRLTEAFLDAKERLDEELLLDGTDSSVPGTSNMKRFKVVLSSETSNTSTGLEVSAVPDPSDPKQNRLLAVEVVRIEEGGRIAQDGRVKVGDQITDINDRPVYQMSLARARLHLHELENIPEPSLSFNRIVEPTSSSVTSAAQLKPITTPLQQANTSEIGETTSATITKGAEGLGFSFAGRANAKNEQLYYVKTVKLGGPASSVLRIGDRILEVDGQSLSACMQTDVAKMLKGVVVGDSVHLIVSRVPEKEPENKSELEETSNRHDTRPASSAQKTHTLDPDREILEFDIPWNYSPSAGLGISLKAQRIFQDGMAVDTGLYIRSVLHGSAAYRDGRLLNDDRLVGVEGVDLLEYSLNGEALGAFQKIKVARKRTSSPEDTKFVVDHPVFPPTKSATIGDIRLAATSTEHGGNNDGTEDDRIFADGNESDSSMQPNPDAFARDTVTRKSMSEKRPFGTRNDPSHLQTYQRIKHQRQKSAPTLNNASPSRVRRRDCRTSLSTADRYNGALSVYNAEPLLPSRKQMTEQAVDGIKKPPEVTKSATANTCSDSPNTARKGFPLLSLWASMRNKRQTVYAEDASVDVNDKENLPKLASPNRRSLSLEPGELRRVLSAKSSGKNRVPLASSDGKAGASDRRGTQEPNRTVVRIPTNDLPPHETAADELLRSPLSKDRGRRDSAEKLQRRKSTGNALLKLFHKHKSHDASSSGFARDSEGVTITMLHDDRATSDNRLTHPLLPTSADHNRSPQVARRHPPPAYRPPPPGVPPPNYPRLPVHHQRFCSAQETIMPQPGADPRSAFVRYQQHRYSGGRQSAIVEHPQPPYPPARLQHPAYAYATGFAQNPMFNYADNYALRQQASFAGTNGYYDAFNAWFAQSANTPTTSAAAAKAAPNAVVHERSRSHGQPQPAMPIGLPPWGLYAPAGIDARPPHPSDPRRLRAQATRSVYSSVGERF